MDRAQSAGVSCFYCLMLCRSCCVCYTGTAMDRRDIEIRRAQCQPLRASAFCFWIRLSRKNSNWARPGTGTTHRVILKNRRYSGGLILKLPSPRYHVPQR